MTQQASVWYRLGYELERLRRRLGPDAEPGWSGNGARTHLLGAVTNAGLSALAARLLPARGPSRARWGRAALAGGGAAAVTHLVRALLALTPRKHTFARGPRALTPRKHTFARGPRAETRGDRDVEELIREILAGAGDGLVYAAFIEPRVPGPAALRGAVYALLDYATAPRGGLSTVLQSLSARRGVHFLASLLRGNGDHRSDSIYDHLLFGLVLGVFYGSSRTRSGIVDAEEDGTS